MYIMHMALHINNSEVEQKVREMASLTGESITEAIGRAADERIARTRSGKGPQRTPSVDEILKLVRSFDLKGLISAASLVETSAVAMNRRQPDPIAALDTLIARLGLAVVPVDHEQALIARDGFRRYEIGRASCR